MYVRCSAILILGVLLFAAACSQTPAQAPVARIGGPHPAIVRAAAGSVWVGKGAVSEPRVAWTLPTRGDVENLDVLPLGSAGGYAVTFRQGGARWQGYLDPKLHAMGELEQVEESATGASRAASSSPTE